jgi:hypothetical protein
MNYSTARQKVYHLLLMPPKPTKTHASKFLTQNSLLFLALDSSKPSLEKLATFLFSE